MEAAKRELLLALFFVVAAIVLTWPLADLTHPQLPVPYDTLFSTWRLAWVAHQLPRDALHLFDANIFWPETNTLAFSDAMLLLGVIGAPLITAGVHPVIVHNLLAIAAFAFAGYAAARLVYRLTSDHGAALIAGMIFAFAPYRFAHIGHLELLWTGFMPLALIALYDLLEQPSARRGAWFGAAVGLQGLCSIYYALFLSTWFVPVIAAARLHLRFRWARRHVAAFAISGVVAVLLLSPYLLPYTHARAQLGPRPEDEVQRYSAVVSDYLRVSSANWLYGSAMEASLEERSLFPGAVAGILATVALVVVRSRTAIAMAIAGVCAFDLSLGVNGLLFDVVRRAVPVLTSIRAPARFGVLVLLAVSVLAGIAIAHLSGKLTARARRALVGTLVIALVIEYWSGPVSMRETRLTPLRVHEWLRDAPRTVVVEIPLPRAEALWGNDPLYEYLSIFHWQPLINGYSGYAPASYVQMLDALRGFPSDDSIRYLSHRGVQLAIIHERLLSPEQFNAILLACGDSRWFTTVVVFDVAPGQGRTAACRLAPDIR